ncbi:MAG: OmpA family protein, partial [Chlorobi bacterium]|nr:OmpA family protein [Chlorobiota bacterium]
NLSTSKENILFTNNKGAVSLKLDKYKLNDTVNFKITFQKKNYSDKTINYDTILYTEGNYKLNVGMQKVKIIEKPDSIAKIDSAEIVKIKKPVNIILKGKAVSVLANTEVSIFDSNGNKINTVKTDKNGEFMFTIKPDSEYKLEGKKLKYKTVSLVINSGTDKNPVTQNLVLTSLPEFNLICYVIDKKTQNPIANAKININDLSKGKKYTLYTDKKGAVSLELDKYKLNDKLKFEIVSEKETYIKKTVNYNTDLNTNGNYIFNIEMQKIEIGKDLGKILEIKPIYFDFGKSVLRTDAKIELDKIVKIMNKFPNMVIELSSYTDCRGTDTYNLKLSEKRANVTVEYIKNRITNPGRIYGKGFGEKFLVNNCNCEGNKISDCSEEEQQKNRRTEFKIIKK